MAPNVLEFDPANKRQTTNYDFPKLSLEQNERARILVIEKAPIYEWVHTVEAPQVVNGKAVMFTDKRKNGTEFQNYKKDFLTRAICLGDVGILNEEGSDPKHCPMCAMAKTDPDMMRAPQRRFAMNIIRYKTKSGGSGFEPTTPFQVELLVWAFTDTVYGQLVDFKETWGSLQKHDLLLGPCTNKMFQKFDINVAPNALWQEDESRKQLVIETHKNNKIEDLSIACGSRKDRFWIDQDLATIRDRWAQVSENAPTLDEDLDSLHEEVWADGKTEKQVAAAKRSTAKATPKSEPENDDINDLLDDVGLDEFKPDGDDLGLDIEESEPAPAKKKPTASTTAKETVPASIEDDLDSLLGD